MEARAIELYKNTHIGIALEETLNKLHDSGEINEDIKTEFIHVFCETLIKTIDEESKNSCSINGYLDTYRNIGNEWNFWIKEAQINSDSGPDTIPMLKVVALSEAHHKVETAEKKTVKKRKLKDEFE